MSVINCYTPIVRFTSLRLWVSDKSPRYQIKILEEDETGKGKGGRVIRAEVAIKLKGRKKKPLDDEEDGELSNTVW